MGKFLEMFQEFGKKRFPYKTVFQAYKWRRYVSGETWFFLIIVTQV